MKKIGEGWQYSVYDLGNGRVLKKFHSRFRSYWAILKTIFPFKDDSLFDIPAFSAAMKKTALSSFEALKRKAIPDDWIGHPRFLNELDFEQDRVEPLSSVFRRVSAEEGKKLIDAFILFNVRLLERGLIDKSFNITKNYGLDKDNEVILIDIGELFDNPARIEEQRRKRAWIEHYVSDEIEDLGSRAYFIRRMDEAFGIKDK